MEQVRKSELKIVAATVIVSGGRARRPQRHNQLSVTARMTIPSRPSPRPGGERLWRLETDRGGSRRPHGRPPSTPSGARRSGVPGHDRVTLAAAPVTPLAGWLTPAAVPSPDGRYVAYNTWRELREDDPGALLAGPGLLRRRPARPAVDPRARPSNRGGRPTSTALSPSPGAATARSRTSRARSATTARVSATWGTSSCATRRTASPGAGRATDRYVVAGWAGPTLLPYRARAARRSTSSLSTAPARGDSSPPTQASSRSAPTDEALVEHGPVTGPPAGGPHRS